MIAHPEVDPVGLGHRVALGNPVDLTTWQEVARVPLDKTPRGLELSPDGRRVFFTLAGVSGFGRAYFEIPHLPAADHYRVSVWDFSFVESASLTR